MMIITLWCTHLDVRDAHQSQQLLALLVVLLGDLHQTLRELLYVLRLSCKHTHTHTQSALKAKS